MMMSSIIMRYGKHGLSLNLPDDLDVTVIRKKVMPVLADPESAMRDAFASPIDSRSLEEEARGCQSACILICDITRPVPNGTVLPILVEILIKAGIKPAGITILVATGLHRPNEGEELRELVGNDWVLQTVTVANHFARRNADHEYLGTLNGSIPVKIDRRFLQADLRIAVGLVEPHFMAGYSGGRKIITPGVAHEDTIRVLHSAAVLEHCRATNCIIDGNPLHDVQMGVLKLVGKCLAVNTVIDEDRRISCINFGEIEASHLAAVAFVRPYGKVLINQRCQTVITSSAGYPLDKTYYQTVKGIVGALDILEPGGDLLIVSECSEGMGSKEFMEAQKELITLGPDRFLEKLLQKSSAAIDEWQSEMLVKALKKGNIYLCSGGLTPEQWALTGVQKTLSPASFLERGLKTIANHRVAVIPEGPYVIPVYHPSDH
jgi:nickel-dependent lactate racemase